MELHTDRNDLTSTVVETPMLVGAESAGGMTMAELRQNYETILRARAIHYPVAYQFPRVLGKGRQGIVFLALRQGARGCITEHAIKVFDPQIYRNPVAYWTDMGRIASQISQLQRIQCPNLVPRHSYEETYGIGYVQMESIDGVDLRFILSGKHVDAVRENSTSEEWARFMETLFYIEGDRMAFRPGLVVHILRGALRGIERLHSANFLHCDIKPGNIMIDRLGNVKVVDFGRAAVVGERSSFLPGSPMYMAPEIHCREKTTIQSDFYSLGLVGLEMLRGKSLPGAVKMNEQQLLGLKMHLQDDLSELLPDYVIGNENLISILKRFIDPDPMKRHPSAKEAESGNEGLKVIDKQFVQEGVDVEYSRDLSDYLAKLVDSRTSRIEVSKKNNGVDPSTETLVRQTGPITS